MKLFKNPYFSLVAAVWDYGRDWRRSIVTFYIAIIISQAVVALSPYAFGRAIDELQNFHKDRLNQVILWLLLGIGVVLVFWIFHGPARLLERTVALKIQQKLRFNFYDKLTRLPLKWHNDNHSGSIITRLNRANVALYRFADNQFLYIQTIVKFFTSIGFLLWISPVIGLISLSASISVITIVISFDRKLSPLYQEENKIENGVGAVLFDYINNISTILTLRLTKLTSNHLFQRMLSIWPTFKKEMVLNEVKWFVMMILFSCTQTGILICYTLYCLKSVNTVMLGVLVMIFRYQWELGNVFEDLSSRYGEIVRLDADVKSIDPILKEIDSLQTFNAAESISKNWREITIKNLSFCHDSNANQKDIFNNIDFTIKKGEKIALIGSSGSGKSTLLNLLAGLYQPKQASMQIDGIISKSLEPLYAITTLIAQEPEVFENTIAFNITMDLPTEPQEIQRVLELSGFASVLETLPNGLATDIRERGLNLSVGQKQRLALSRGLLAARYSSIILMDEPTSSVDLITERKILGGVISSFSEATMIISLHSLHLLLQFDRVIMIENGKVLANGPVSKLLNTHGPVQVLWNEYMLDQEKKQIA